MPNGQKKQVVILGGGIGGVTAAFYLTATEALRAEYDVTLYQEGHRLGGKCATGRRADACCRLEEHGIHILLGFYENAFRTFRACIDAWQDKPAGYDGFDAFFSPAHQVSMADHLTVDGSKRWLPYSVTLPERAGSPGDGQAPPDPWDDLTAMARWLWRLVSDHGSGVWTVLPNPFEGLLSGAEVTVGGVGLTASGQRSAMRTTIRALQRLINRAVTAIEGDLDGANVELYRIWNLAAVGAAVSLGYLEDVLLGDDDAIDRLNRVEFRDWLQHHGLPASLRWSAPVRALYELAFAFPSGTSSAEGGQLAAGSALMTALRLTLRYKGAPLWHMRLGTADTLMTPMYEVLRQRGVRFEFFHRLRRLDVDAERVTRIEFGVQAKPKTGAYAPLVPVNGYPCWPSSPLWAQLQGGDTPPACDFESPRCQHFVDHTTLHADVDFDHVVLATSIAGIEDFAPELASRPRWRAMLDAVPTVGTRAAQLWLQPSLAELGWTHGQTILTAYAPSMTSWGDYSLLLSKAAWTPGDVPHTAAYFCGVAPDDIDATQVRDDFGDWVDAHLQTLWSAVPDRAALEETLHRFENIEGDPLQQQYFRSNTERGCSGRYVLSPPGSIEHRLHADGSGLSNLVLAGDWVRTQIDGGAVEAAVEGGMRASQAICNWPPTIAKL